MKNKKFVIRGIFILALLFAAVVGVQAQGKDMPNVVSAFGQANVNGEKVFVHVTAVVPPGANANEVARDAVRAQGARPIDSNEFTTNGLVWDQFLDNNTANDFVTQNYNPANDPAAGAGYTALKNSQATWTNVASSKFALSDGGTTNRCPSLVRECDGPQVFDGKNDVAWLDIKGCCTLGVTWFGTSTDEADMALNTKFSWFTNGVNNFDIETVFLHENGHVGGLGHSNVLEAVMYPSYQAVRRALHQDDVNGISFLYPFGPVNAAPSISITSPANNSSFSSGAVITFQGTASDTEDVNLTATIGWSSSINGVLGTGGTVSTTLSDGSHTITATVTDSGGKTASAIISITVGAILTPTSVNVSAITYAIDGGRNGDKNLLVTIALQDNLGNPVSGASVGIKLTRAEGGSWIGNGTTGTGGTVTFILSNAPSGTYTTSVNSVSASGLDWNGTYPANSFIK